MRKASWIVLTLVGVLTLMGGLGSMAVAYFADPVNDTFGAAEGARTVADVAAWDPQIAEAVRARRGTASAYAVSYAALFLAIVLVPYRRGEVWSWWALFVGAALLAAVYGLRVPTLGTQLGAGVGLSHFVAALVGLLLDVRRLRGPAAAA